MNLVAIFSACVLVGIAQAAPTPSETYTHNAILMSPDIYHVYWKLDGTGKTITFEVHVKTTGYVGFGLTPNGQMKGSDMVIGWVKDGTTHFKDRYATGQSAPAIDPSQDWVLISGSETGGYTVLKFSRSVISCDKTGNDIDITSGTMRLIFSYKDTDPISESSLAYHGSTQRGTKSIQLLSDNTKPTAIPSNAQYFDLMNDNITVPSADTTYWCKGFKLPTFAGKRHVVMIEPLVQAGHESLVHHILIYSCWHKINDSDIDNIGQQCFTANMPGNIDQCTSIMFAWAIGGGKFYLPAHTGYPLGQAIDPNYVRMETHYDNPAGTSGMVDGSGMRIWYTSTLRTNDAAVLETGMQVSPEHIIPAKVTGFTNKGYCTSQCMTEAFGSSQASGIKVFASMVHTHLVGTGIKVSHLKQGGIEQPTLDQDLSYDFNFQETRHLPAEITVMPTDDLIVSCIYTTTSRTSYTVGGIKSADEMCLVYMFYYPRVNLTKCESITPFSETVKLGGDLSVTGVSGYPYHKITTSGTYKDKTVMDIVTATDWTQSSNVQKYETIVNKNPVRVTCKGGSSITYPINGQMIYPINITTAYNAPVTVCTAVLGGSQPGSTAAYVTACPLLATILMVLAAMF